MLLFESQLKTIHKTRQTMNPKHSGMCYNYPYLLAAVAGAAHPLRRTIACTKPVLAANGVVFAASAENSFLHASVPAQWSPKGEGTASELLAIC